MKRVIVTGSIAMQALGAGAACAQPRPPAPPSGAPAASQPEIKLDEQATLKAAALEARMSALLANYALLQRQAQDMQQEMARMLEERKKLIEEAARKANTEVGNPNEWAFDNKNERYLKLKRTP
ncbi:MAG TPA: hypothetical protein VMR23_08090 [Candidatus Limnocylindria bacterium]|nr:hypothetical protein [Candidatus Limnocylindria bacterium]